ncbi:hypothetical protein C1H46_032972 [Malus baccata]|uniref:Uncharacterized protein n=1 Tax=Malus baccata TaxID=106549 RepID=A0A540L566_MALBA|nr:hypothetical protein C1H46_032972 [Malus baccata]
MEWTTVQHLDLRHVGRSSKPLQPHAAAFHPHQALVAVAIGNYIIEMDALTGSKISSIDIGTPIVRMSYSPTSGHSVVAILEYVAYADGLIRAYNIHTYAVHYTLQIDNTIKLIGAGAFGFHPTLEWIFVGDRRGTLLAWDVSTERPSMIGITQVGSQPIASVSWLPMLRLLVTVSKDGTLQVWKTRVIINPNRPPMQANFFEPAAIESLDIPRILSQQGGEAAYPLPRIKTLEVHSKLNLAALLFANMTGGDNVKNRAAYTREGRKQLFAVLQGARGSSASVLKEKLSALGSSGILAEHQLQAQLQEHHSKGRSQLTISDIARKAFLHSHFMEGHAKSAPISRLPLITIIDTKHHLKDFPVFQPFHLELNFFNKENRVLHYPVRAFYVDGLHLMAYNICSGADSIYKKLYTTVPGNVEYHPKYMAYGKKQGLFLVVYEFSGATNEVVLYFENTNTQAANSKCTTIKGRDAAFIGPNENQFAILDDDKTGLVLYILPKKASPEANEKNLLAEESQPVDTDAGPKGPMQFMFESEVDRIFSTPIESTLMFASHGSQIGLAKLIQGYRLSNSGGHYIATKGEGKKSIKLKLNEIVLQESVVSLPCALRIVGLPMLGGIIQSVIMLDKSCSGRSKFVFKRMLMFGQFDSAKETFEVIGDYESMLDLFICHLNPSAMRRLAQKLEEDGTDSELRRYCERILRARSTGWTQGIFANFAAESMVPKGPEWGGGNWEIKTPTNMKAIPQWELAAEVMPYMKTDDGTIPSIIADHIGVYLGSIKGRGNIVEVREDSLVKAFKSAGGGNKPNGLPLSTSTSNMFKGVPAGDSLMGLETLNNKQFASSSAADEQAKAEEEFKKTMYGAADGSSSDEEGTSKAKKLHIRIRDKPIASTAVDVDKIKEATKQLKLGEGLGPPMTRTKSLTIGSQDLSQMLSQPPPPANGGSVAPRVGSAPGDLFGMDSFTQPATVSHQAPTSTGKGVGPAPIPEDFFQNTIPSLQVAATLPPPGTYLSKMDQASQGFESNKEAFNQANASNANVRLPDAGVPPQASQPAAAPFEPVGLPDGGVPPSSGQVAAQHQSHIQSTQFPVSTQPLDLSVLGVPTSADSGKPSAQPSSPPSSVRPGQVPRGAAASVCFKTGVAHLEQNQLSDALSCFDEAFLALAKDQSRGADIKAQGTICAQYKIAVTLLREIGRLQRVQGPSAISAKDEMARLSRHLGSLPLLAKHRINCIRTAIKRNMEVQNYAYSKQMLELLLSKAPPSKQEELRSLVDMCVQRGLSNKSIDPLEDPSQFCAATLSRLSTIGYDVCDLCGAKFSALSSPGCIICGMGSIKRSDARTGPGPVPSPFG